MSECVVRGLSTEDSLALENARAWSGLCFDRGIRWWANRITLFARMVTHILALKISLLGHSHRLRIQEFNLRGRSPWEERFTAQGDPLGVQGALRWSR